MPIIPDSFKFSLAKNKKEQFSILKGLMNREDMTSLVNACDAGRERELIFRLIFIEKANNPNYTNLSILTKTINLSAESAVRQAASYQRRLSY